MRTVGRGWVNDEGDRFIWKLMAKLEDLNNYSEKKEKYKYLYISKYK